MSIASTQVDGPAYVDAQPAGGGWLTFAGTILGLAGVMRIIDALWTFSYRGQLPEDLQDGLLGSELETYGWIWLVVGILLVVASICVVARIQIARWFGIVAAGLSAVASTMWMPYYPVWALTYIALAVLVIYALSRYGGHDPAP